MSTAAGSPAGPSARRLAAAALLVGIVAGLAATAGAGVRSTYGGAAAVDEPQYLLTALSLAEDRDLDIADELAARRWRAWHDSELPVQTEVLPGGRELSPHDPLLPVLLAVPLRAGGLGGARLALAGTGGLLAALLVWTAVRRLQVPLVLAAAGIALAAASAPYAVYGSQVYPELPAALAVTAAAAALLGPLRRGGLVALATAVLALPWLSVKYVPVAAALAAVAVVRLLRRGERRPALVLGGTLAVAGAAYVAAHLAWYGGLTVYAAGDHFQRSGEFGVTGFAPDLPGRAARLVGLLTDRDFGLLTWQPAWLLAVPAAAWLAARRPPGWAVLAVPLAAGWLNATFVALTMHGYWWAGRQVVVVLPLAVLAVLAWLATLPRRALLAAAALAGAGVWTYGRLVVAGRAGDLTWVTGASTVDDPLHRLVARLLPDYRTMAAPDVAGHVAWTAVVVALLLLGARHAGRGRATPARPDGHRRDGHRRDGHPRDGRPRRPVAEPIAAAAAAAAAAVLLALPPLLGHDDGRHVRDEPGTGDRPAAAAVTIDPRARS